MTPFGVYIHFPYCRRRCPYCDFAVAARRTVPHERYLRAILDELRVRAALFPGRRAVSVYFGGGTPSLWRPGCVAEALAAVLATFPPPDGVVPEVTVECDPKDLQPAGLAGLRRAGANRISLGVQSLSERHLQALGRLHTPDEARRAVAACRAAGFDNLSVDLMIGLPEQTRAELDQDLEGLLELAPEHVSLYQLTVEPRTALAARVRRGLVVLPDQDVQAGCYERVRDTVEAAGLVHYEISSFARMAPRDRRAVHNRLYWTLGEYLGLGVSAHSFRRDGDGGGERFGNPRGVDEYLGRAAIPAPAELPVHERLAREELLREALWLGLRQIGGISRRDFAGNLGEDPVPAEGPRRQAIERLRQRGLLCLEGDVLRLSRAGVLFADEVGAAFL